MTLQLNGWDMHDIEVAMREKTVFEILSMYKEKQKEMSDKGAEYIVAMKDRNETAKERIEKEFQHLEKESCVIALRIADEFTKDSKTI